MTPIWIFPAYPLLLTAPFASNIIDAVPTAAAATRINAIAISLTAVSIQGAGFMVSMMIYSAFIYRLMTRKLPNEPTRPGIFVSVGPSGFTVAGIVHLANDLKEKIVGIDEAFGSPNGVADASFVLKILADVMGLWLWGLCIWYDSPMISIVQGLVCAENSFRFFLVSIGSHWTLLLRPKDDRHKNHRIHFAMTWFVHL